LACDILISVGVVTSDCYQCYEKAHYLKENSDEAIDTLIMDFKNRTSSMSVPFF